MHMLGPPPYDNQFLAFRSGAQEFLWLTFGNNELVLTEFYTEAGDVRPLYRLVLYERAQIQALEHRTFGSRGNNVLLHDARRETVLHEDNLNSIIATAASVNYTRGIRKILDELFANLRGYLVQEFRIEPPLGDVSVVLQGYRLAKVCTTPQCMYYLYAVSDYSGKMDTLLSVTSYAHLEKNGRNPILIAEVTDAADVLHALDLIDAYDSQTRYKILTSYDKSQVQKSVRSATSLDEDLHVFADHIEDERMRKAGDAAAREERRVQRRRRQEDREEQAREARIAQLLPQGAPGLNSDAISGMGAVDILEQLHTRLGTLEACLHAPFDVINGVRRQEAPRVFSTDLRAFFVRHRDHAIVNTLRLYNDGGVLLRGYDNKPALSTAEEAEWLINYLHNVLWERDERNLIRVKTPGDFIDSRDYTTLLTDADRAVHPRVFSTDLRAFFVRHRDDEIVFTLRLYNGDVLAEAHDNKRTLSTAADAEALINYLHNVLWEQGARNLIRVKTPGDYIDTREYTTLLTDADMRERAREIAQFHSVYVDA